MTRFELSFRQIATAAAVFGFVVSFASTSHAITAEQRSACMPDVFRLCASEIPNVDGTIACMRKHASSLSAACKAVLDK